jgi:chromosome segregation ATPase
VNADFSRSTMDTLVDTKDAMKSMQENFILIESSLKSKNYHLLQQLEEREIKLAEAEAKILNLETGIGIKRQPNVEELSYKIEKLEETNRILLDEKYELQKHVADLQDKIISYEFSSNADLSNEKDNRIAELEATIEELRISSQQIEEIKINVDKQILDLNERNEETSSKCIELEKQLLNLETEKSQLIKKLTISDNEAPKENEKEQSLLKELDELNKSMIKMKVEHKNKLKNMRKQINSFTKVILNILIL